MSARSCAFAFLLAPLALALSACDEPSTPQTARGLPQGFRAGWQQGKADTGGCAGFCGGQARSGCWCDAACHQNGDCCPDKVSVCDQRQPTCAGHCGSRSPDGCWCDDTCAQYGDCCPDKAQQCDAPVDPCAGVTCDEPPAPHCVNASTLRRYESPGSCSAGACDYTATDEACAAGCANGTCQATTVDLFDPTLAQGTPITLEQAKARFAPGSTTAKLGEFVMRQRSRTCNTTTGCASWAYPADVQFAYMTYQLWIPGPGWSAQKSCFQFKSAKHPEVQGQLSLVVASGGKIDLQLAAGPTGAVTCADVTSGSSRCDTLRSNTFGTGLTGGTSCSLPNPAGSGYEKDVYPITVPLYDTTDTDGKRLALNLLVTDSHVYGRSLTQSKKADNGSYTEVEYALYGVLEGTVGPIDGGPGPCTPTTCAAQGKNCGTIDDGCGGTLHCGNCAYPYVCSDEQKCEVPPGCNLQPCYAPATVSHTCCSAGRRTCPNGSGCTCYDAC